ncbi:MAG: type III-A CRISPR-associated RAMP protein Csm4 [Flammeovirgaceae bacterium]|nr:type III-A CRISPR-associated RAMP protein Csm4 [Flammeovirgaceae bacterium]
MTTRLFHFKFTAPLHIANVRADYDRSETTLSSDTLYAAVMSAWAMLGKSEWITPEPAFALSSLFPYYYKKYEQVRYFLPKPTGVLKTKDQDIHKKIKKVRYIEAGLFAKWAKGMAMEEADTNCLAGDFYLEKPLNDEQREVIKNFVASEVYPRVRVPRVEKKDADPYYIERIWFAEGSGLYCLFVGSEEDYRKVKTALNFLQYEGIGTDRHVGNGLFTLEESALPESFRFDVAGATHWVNLSLFCPESAEQLESLLPEADSHIAYELVQRGGWITTEPFLTLRKKHVYMLREGSVFANSSTSIQVEANLGIAGKTHNVRPEWNDDRLHPVYRCGRAIFVPVKMN